MLRQLIVFISALFLFLPAFAQAEEFVYDRILVKINDDIITQYDLNEEMKPILEKIGDRSLNDAEKAQLEKMRKQVLDRMVNDRLMQQEIKRFEINVTDDRVDKEIERLKEERNMTDEEFAATIEKDGMTMPQFRTKLKGLIEKQDLLNIMVRSKVVVTDSEIQAEYEKNRDNYAMDKTVALSIIILPSEVSAEEVKKRIGDGELTFAEAAEKYTIGPGKDKGGAIGEVVWNDLADEWQEALEGLPEGAVSSPIEVQSNDALLSPVKIVDDRLVPLDDVRDEIFKRLMEAKRETLFEQYFDKLKQSSVIVYMN